jgi:hypothetical protein
MNRLKDHYDVIAVAVLIAVLAFAPSVDTLDKKLRFVHLEQPTVIVVHR